MRLFMLALGGALVCSTTAPASAADPRVPAGTDPGGIAIALVGDGIDYTDPEIAPRLARDGEGELIGWDFVDNDRFPYAPQTKSPSAPNGTALARRLIKVYRQSRLVPVRVPSMEPAVLANVIQLLARTPARIVAMPAWGDDRAKWEPFRQAAAQASGLLLVVAGGDAGTLGGHAPAWPAAFRLDNVVAASPAAFHPGLAGSPTATGAAAAVDAWVVAPGASMFPSLAGKSALELDEAVALAAGLAACAQHAKPAGDGKAAKAALSALARPASSGSVLPVHDPMCWYGGVRN